MFSCVLAGACFHRFCWLDLAPVWLDLAPVWLDLDPPPGLDWGWDWDCGWHSDWVCSWGLTGTGLTGDSGPVLQRQIDGNWLILQGIDRN